MREFDRYASLALDEIDSIAGRLSGLDETAWQLPTRCSEWTVHDLARHVAAVIWQQSEAFHRARMGIAEAPSYVRINDAPHDLVSAMAQAKEFLEAAISALPRDDDPTVPLPFAAMPASFAIFVLLIEYGTHRNDLEWALGDECDLRAEVAKVQVDLLPVFLPMIATDPPSQGAAAYRLVADSGATCVAARDGGWHVTDEPSEDECEIKGSDSAIALFSLGRIASDHPTLTVTGPDHLARDFKRYFPGP